MALYQIGTLFIRTHVAICIQSAYLRYYTGHVSFVYLFIFITIIYFYFFIVNEGHLRTHARTHVPLVLGRSVDGVRFNVLCTNVMRLLLEKSSSLGNLVINNNRLSKSSEKSDMQIRIRF